MSIQDKKIFRKLNSDSDPRLLGEGEIRYALNARYIINSQGTGGAAENVAGNTQIINPNLPSGTNRCLGSYEDKEGNGIIFLNFNSNNNHGIYEYFPDSGQIQQIVQNPLLNFQKFGAINSIDLIGGLLYLGSDGTNSPRKINIIKGNNTTKNLIANVYFEAAQISSDGATQEYASYSITGGGVINLSLNVPQGTNVINDSPLIYLSEQFAYAWNNNATLASIASASACNGYVQLTTIIVNKEIVWSIVANDIGGNPLFTLKCVANNYYPSGNNFRIDFIERIKYPLAYEPTVKVLQDPSRASNLVVNHDFQFCAQVVYDDNEESTLSPISVIPLQPSSCGTVVTSLYNMIQVGWDNNPRFEDVNVLSIIKYVNLFVRVGNTAQFGFIISMPREQFLPVNNTFNFYNDGIYEAIDPALAALPSSDVPLLNDSQVLADDRIFDGGVTEGYDPICLKDKLTLTYQQNKSSNTFTIAGSLLIKNLFATNSSFIQQPITTTDRTSPGPAGDDPTLRFGGLGPTFERLDLSTGSVYVDPFPYNQSIPLGGFVIYLAGTNLRGITQQVSSTNGAFIPGARPLPRTDREQLSSAMQKGELFTQNYNINNVPPGWYIMRIGDHTLTQNDLNAQGLDWQKRSTNCLKVGGIIGYECLIQVLDISNVYPTGGIIVYNKGSDTVGTFYPAAAGVSTITGNCEVADLTDVAALSVPLGITVAYSVAIGGYVMDDVTEPIGTNWFNNTPIQLAKAVGSVQSPAQGPFAYGMNGVLDTYTPTLIYMKSGVCFTDHNGYFFVATRRLVADGSGQSFDVVYNSNGNAGGFNSGIYPLRIGATGAQWIKSGIATDPTVSAWSAIQNAGYQLGIFSNQNPQASLYARTMLIGNVGVDGIYINSTQGGGQVSSGGGSFSVTIYVDSTINFSPLNVVPVPGNTLPTSINRNDFVVYNFAGLCRGSFNPNPDPYNIEISNAATTGSGSTPSPYTGIYDEAFYVMLVDVVTTIISAITTINSLKIGGKYNFGKVYYDDGNRGTTVLTDNDLILYIPYPTQKDIANTPPIVGGTIPIVTWDIYNPPPSWATHYQWVRTLNGDQGSYLQWAVKAVVYLDAGNNVTSYAEAVYIQFDLENIPEFATDNPGSLVGYTFQQGQRLVLLRDGSGNYFQQYFDLSVQGAQTGALLRISCPNNALIPQLSAGTLVEIYNPAKVQTTPLYYEIGESFPIKTDLAGNLVHGGLTVDQEFWNFDDNFNDPVTGLTGFVNYEGVPNTLKVGDTITVSSTPYNGIAHIKALTTTIAFPAGSVVIVTDILWIGATPVSPGTVVRAAEGVFRTGDTWNRLRNIPYLSTNNPNPAPGPASDKFIVVQVEDASISDFFISNDQPIGRPNVVDNTVGRLYRPSTIKFSDLYVQDTKINGLSNTQPLNEKELPSNYGSIQRLIFTKTTLLAIHANSQVVSMEINKQTLRDAGVQAIVAISESVLPSDYEYQGSLGTQNPESVVKDDDDKVWGWDGNKGIIWERSVNGLRPVSELGMKTFFRNLANSMRNTGIQPFIPVFYDRGFNQVGWSFNPIYSPDTTRTVVQDNPVNSIVPVVTQVEVITPAPNIDILVYPYESYTITTPASTKSTTYDGAIYITPLGTYYLLENNGTKIPLPVGTTVETRGVTENTLILTVPVAVPAPPTITYKDVTTYITVTVETPTTVTTVTPGVLLLPGTTIAFNKSGGEFGAWESFYSFIPEMWGRGKNNEVVSFVNGALWRHNINPLYNNFYGVQNVWQIEVIGNKGGSVVKSWINISTESSDVWSAPTIKTLEGQMSQLAATDFELINRVFSADFLRDMNTPNKPNALIFGDFLQSAIIDVLLQSNVTGYSTIFAVNIYGVTSEKTNKT